MQMGEGKEIPALQITLVWLQCGLNSTALECVLASIISIPGYVW